MTLNQLIFKVLLNPYVIGTTIAVILMLNFCCYVASYRKKTPKPKEGGSEASSGNASPAPES